MDYLVFIDSYIKGDEHWKEHLVLIDAYDADEALTVYARERGVEEDLFKRYIYCESLLDSMAFHFIRPFEKENGDVLNAEGGFAYPWEVINAEVEKGARAFFGNHSEYADLYIAFYHDLIAKDDDSWPNVEKSEAAWPFPLEMRVQMYRNDWGEDVFALPVAEIPRLHRVAGG